MRPGKLRRGCLPTAHSSVAVLALTSISAEAATASGALNVALTIEDTCVVGSPAYSGEAAPREQTASAPTVSVTCKNGAPFSIAAQALVEVSSPGQAPMITESLSEEESAPGRVSTPGAGATTLITITY